jgi:hypothetical protein
MKLVNNLKTFYVYGAMIIPLNSNLPEWKAVSFPKIKPNEISFSEKGLIIEVNRSSSPLFYKLSKPTQVAGFSVEGNLSGLPEINRLKEGDSENDDFSLRVGFVETNTERPSWIERLWMADWINELLNLFPDQGLNKVRFFTLSQMKNPGTFRVHPKNDLVEETVVLKKEQPGNFSIDYQFPKPIPAMALWLQPDGDHSKSTFVLTLTHLAIQIGGE